MLNTLQLMLFNEFEKTNCNQNTNKQLFYAYKRNTLQSLIIFAICAHFSEDDGTFYSKQMKKKKKKKRKDKKFQSEKEHHTNPLNMQGLSFFIKASCLAGAHSIIAVSTWQADLQESLAEKIFFLPFTVLPIFFSFTAFSPCVLVLPLVIISSWSSPRGQTGLF